MTILALAACQLTGIENPTGTCLPDDDGSRACYHSPGADSQYLPHCDAPLAHEYWRVFGMEDDTGVTAYMIPRPDGTAPLDALCAEGSHGDLLAAYTLCDASVDIDLVNAMDPADALDLSFALHERLVFSAVDYGDMVSVEPWAPPSDVLAICDTGADDGLAELCETYAEYYGGETCLDIAVGFDLETAAALAAAMNDYYGVVAE